MRLAHPVRAVPVADLLPATECVLGSGMLMQTGVAHLFTRPAILVAVVLPHEFTSFRVELFARWILVPRGSRKIGTAKQS